MDADDDDDEKLLKKILSRNLNSAPSLLSPVTSMISDDLISYLNNGKKTTDNNEIEDSDVIGSKHLNEEADFQLIEPDLNTETNVEEIILDENKMKETETETDEIKQDDPLNKDSKNCLNQEKTELNTNRLDDSINSMTEIFATAKQLVDDVIRNTQQKLVFSETIQSNDNSSILMNQSTLTNFNDSNDLSQSIEKLKLSEDPEESISTFSSDYKSDNDLSNGIIDNSTISTSINDEEDSDIEVLTISSKLTNKLVQDVALIKLNEALPSTNTSLLKPGDKLKSAALLDSITEHEVECLFKNNALKSNGISNSIKEELVNNEIENESAAIISNYDMITDHPQEPWVIIKILILP